MAGGFPCMFRFLQHKYLILVSVFSTALKSPTKASEGKKKITSILYPAMSKTLELGSLGKYKWTGQGGK